MTTYYYEYRAHPKSQWDFHQSGIVEAQNEHIAVQIIKDELRNLLPTEMEYDLGEMLFTELPEDETSVSMEFTEEDWEEYWERKENSETITFDRDEYE